jgi:hypothetical protein
MICTPGSRRAVASAGERKRSRPDRFVIGNAAAPVPPVDRPALVAGRLTEPHHQPGDEGDVAGKTVEHSAGWVTARCRRCAAAGSATAMRWPTAAVAR